MNGGNAFFFPVLSIYVAWASSCLQVINLFKNRVRRLSQGKVRESLPLNSDDADPKIPNAITYKRGILVQNRKSVVICG
ncbi:hypothetical protein QQP08_011028 [Theobroma cacao]|uniref:Uncharacterized protein n=1 Tax=Theobroma cacao TaxID=3641 RepID=A0A061G025_THECC|nr:Uncharacterized protein TCM_014784 [Theobroma cacao]WRX18541.1 hypothetical protein QQP08_011028 [Theobroma cacao]